MEDFIRQNPEILIILVKWLISLLAFCAVSFITLFVYMFKQMRKTIADLSLSLKSLKDLVQEIALSLRELWAEHKILSAQAHCADCSANERKL